MSIYQKLIREHQVTFAEINKKYNLISSIRLVLALFGIYVFYRYVVSNEVLFLAIGLTITGCFLWLMKTHKRLSIERNLVKTLIIINQDEAAHQNRESTPFANGSEYINTEDVYSYDLDIFGEDSIFHNLNRTATFIGSHTFSTLLKTRLPETEIVENQQAIAEAAHKVAWRQTVCALARQAKDTRDNYDKLVKWSSQEQKAFSRPFLVLCYLVPLLFCVSFILVVLTSKEIFYHVSAVLFLVNLIIAFSQSKKIKQSILDSDKLSKVIKQYGLILDAIEQEQYSSKKLKALQNVLLQNNSIASEELKKLGVLFANTESIENGMAAVILNGSVLYHIHVQVKLIRWKQKHAKYIKNWIDVIGQFEALNSLGNFSYNNPLFVFPEINSSDIVELENMGHPLLAEEERVCNSVSFSNANLIVLTGSNMSGKSTFLRSLGVNLVLSGIGSPICSTAASIHPQDVIVSMRQADSLSKGHSYFFAEVNRLKQLFERLETRKCFVLLDEILRGTNSDDKRNGTIEVIKKLVAKNAVGVIATHDLEVCEITKEYPDQLANKHFEVQISGNEMSFDYLLRDGVCKNKSATFLMKKMGVI